jgi:anti-anti-sigma factor
MLCKRYNSVINFVGVTYFSSSAMRIVIALQNRLDELGGKLKLASINSMVEKILVTLDLYELYDIYESVGDALSSG